MCYMLKLLISGLALGDLEIQRARFKTLKWNKWNSESVKKYYMLGFVD